MPAVEMDEATASSIQAPRTRFHKRNIKIKNDRANGTISWADYPMPRQPKRQKRPEEHAHLAIRVKRCEVSVEASVNYNVYAPQSAWNSDDDDPLYRFTTRLYSRLPRRTDSPRSEDHAHLRRIQRDPTHHHLRQDAFLTGGKPLTVQETMRVTSFLQTAARSLPRTVREACIVCPYQAPLWEWRRAMNPDNSLFQ